MFNVIDLIVLLIIAIAALLGYKRGFVKTSFRMLSFIIAIVISMLLYKPVASYIKESTNVSEWLVQTILGKDNKEELESVPENDNLTLVEDTSDVTKKEESTNIENALESLPQNIKEYIGVNETINQAKEQVAEKIVDAIINVMSLVLIYVIVKLALSIVCFILDKIMQIPLLKQINEAFGLMLGLLLGIIQVYTVLAVITFLSSFIQMPELIAYIKASLITSVLFEYNLLIALIF